MSQEYKQRAQWLLIEGPFSGRVVTAKRGPCLDVSSHLQADGRYSNTRTLFERYVGLEVCVNGHWYMVGMHGNLGTSLQAAQVRELIRRLCPVPISPPTDISKGVYL